jgi:hypothetical protein
MDLAGIVKDKIASAGNGLRKPIGAEELATLQRLALSQPLKN